MKGGDGKNDRNGNKKSDDKGTRRMRMSRKKQRMNRRRMTKTRM